MPTIIRILSTILIIVVIRIIIYMIQKNNEKEAEKNSGKEHITLRLPRVYLWAGVFGILVFSTLLILMVLFPNDTASLWVYVVFIFFILLGVFIVLGAQFWKIDVFTKEDYFLYRNWNCRTYKILYSDCISYKFGKSNTLILHTKKKKIYIDLFTTNLETILSMLTEHKVKENK